MNKVPYEVEGFAFPDEKLLEKAVKEAEGIRYVKQKADMAKPQVIQQIYCQMVRQRLFETPVGYSFLSELQAVLKADPNIRDEEIPPIPVIVRKEQRPAQADAGPARPPQQRAQQPAKTKTKIVYQTKVRNIDYKKWFRTSMIFTVLLFLIVAGMFAVTATSGNVNIVNYENALIEKYEAWETDLDEREAKLRERMKEMSQ